jgi:hypothetical protein
MRHFIAYHNPEKMGYQYSVHKDNHERVLTNKPVHHVVGNMVWVVTFKERHDYALACVFQVDECGDTNAKGFKHWISGKGRAFRPWRDIKNLDWFPNLMKATGNFGLGLQEVTEPSVVAGLLQIAERDGHAISGNRR